MENYKVKQLAEDFQVTEVLSTPQPNSTASTFIYLLKKSGYRTLEVIAKLEQLLNIRSPEKIGFSGLKDEDGVTLQHITMPRRLTEPEIELIHKRLHQNTNQYATIRFFLPANTHLKVGGLHGNCFRVKVRKLSKRIVHKITDKKEHSLFFINYYGPQRFGLPNQVKNTWKIGRALIQRDFTAALHELQQQSSPEANEARQFSGTPGNFFSCLDKRLVAFFQSSYFSKLWNNTIIQSISSLGIKSAQMQIDDIVYLLPLDQEATVRTLAANLNLTNRRAVVRRNEVGAHEYNRPPVISTKVIVEDSGIDDRNDGSYCCTLSFFLPSGCYASMLIPQFLKYVEHELVEKTKALETC